MSKSKTVKQFFFLSISKIFLEATINKNKMKTKWAKRAFVIDWCGAKVVSFRNENTNLAFSTRICYIFNIHCRRQYNASLGRYRLAFACMWVFALIIAAIQIRIYQYIVVSTQVFAFYSLLRQQRQPLRFRSFIPFIPNASMYKFLRLIYSVNNDALWILTIEIVLVSKFGLFEFYFILSDFTCGHRCGWFCTLKLSCEFFFSCSI